MNLELICILSHDVNFICHTMSASNDLAFDHSDTPAFCDTCICVPVCFGSERGSFEMSNKGKPRWGRNVLRRSPWEGLDGATAGVCQLCMCAFADWAVWFHSFVKDWRKWIQEAGWAGADDRLAKLCRWIVESDVMHWKHLEFADDPSTWDGGDMFAADELALLKRVASEQSR